jgi:hypothetical protein
MTSKTVCAALLSVAVLILPCGLAYAQAGPQPASRPPAVIPFIVDRFGFRPKEITLPAGPASLVVWNRTGIRQPVIQLDRQTGPSLQVLERVRDTVIARDRKMAIDTFALTPGTYVVRIAGQPQMTARIQVLPEKR